MFGIAQLHQMKVIHPNAEKGIKFDLGDSSSYIPKRYSQVFDCGYMHKIISIVTSKGFEVASERKVTFFCLLGLMI